MPFKKSFEVVQKSQGKMEEKFYMLVCKAFTSHSSRRLVKWRNTWSMCYMVRNGACISVVNTLMEWISRGWHQEWNNGNQADCSKAVWPQGRNDCRRMDKFCLWGTISMIIADMMSVNTGQKSTAAVVWLQRTFQ